MTLKQLDRITFNSKIIEFLADMGISLRTVSWLREQGYDVVHLRDEGLQTLSDQ